MRSAPPVVIRSVPGRHDPWWLLGWVTAALAALSLSLLWCVLHWPGDDAATRAARSMSPMVCLALGISGLYSLWRVDRHGWRLHWDGQCWWLHLLAPASEPLAGRVQVAMDLGGWLLLQFRSDAASGAQRRLPHRPTDIWLTASRSRHPGEWHLLRCAVYSPRPSAPAVPAATHNPGVSCPATDPDER